MRNMWKTLGLMATLLLSTIALAQGRFDGQLADNEDLQFIRQWQRSQTVAELASALALTQEQVDTLNAVKADLEAIKADYEPQVQAAIDQLAATAAQVRANIVATNALSEDDKAALREARQAIGAVMREQRGEGAVVLGDLEGLLTEEQRETMTQILRRQKPDGDDDGAAARFKGNRGQGNSNLGQNNRGRQGVGGAERGGRGERRGARMAVRILLSDEFLSHYNN